MSFRLVALSLGLIAAAHAASAKVSDEKVERSGAEKLTIAWTDAKPIDIYVSDQPDATIDRAKLLTHGDKSGHYETKATASRVYFLLREAADGSTVRVAERVLPLTQGSNFRDIGGYPAASGKRVRWGMLFRSGGSPMLSEADLAQIQALGLKDMVDLRSSEERVLAPTRIEGIRYTAVGYAMQTPNRPLPTSMSQVGDSYRNFPTMLAPQLRLLFRDLLSAQAPLVYNCTAGQDRTGFTTAILLSALGVPHETILADYHLSTVYRHPEFELPKLDPEQATNPTAKFFAQMQKDGRMTKPQPLYDTNHRALLEYAFDEIQMHWGSVEAYLDKEAGVSAADLARLKELYLE